MNLPTTISLLCLGAMGMQARASFMQDGAVTTQEIQPEPAETQTYEIPEGHSVIIEPGWKVSEVAVAREDVADVKVVSPERVMIVGNTVGTTDVTMWSKEGDRWDARIIVQVDIEHLRIALEEAIPTADLELSQSRDVVVVTGMLRRAEDADALHRFMDATEIKYVDMSQVAGLQQVMIKVRVAEANRVAIRSLGMNAFHSGDSFFGGSTVGGNQNHIDIGVPGGTPASDNLPFTFQNSTSVGDAVTLFAGFPGLDFQLFIEALEDNQYIRTLAQPTLVAMSGEKASFLAGGEFPIPVAQGSGLGGTTVTIEYKEFGVRLNFLPTVLGDGSIRLQVAPEVSDLSDVGAVEIQGFRIPALLTRRAATTLKMKSGQTFAMAGLIDRNVAARAQGVPGLANVPILGTLFRSVRYEAGETELVVLATVELVEPLDTAENMPLPGDSHITPSDWELYAEGRIHAKGESDHPPAEWALDLGFDKLKGPGAWATHDQKRVPVRAEAMVDTDTKNGAN